MSGSFCKVVVDVEVNTGWIGINVVVVRGGMVVMVIPSSSSPSPSIRVAAIANWEIHPVSSSTWLPPQYWWQNSVVDFDYQQQRLFEA
jgi:hypothetical protein